MHVVNKALADSMTSPPLHASPWVRLLLWSCGVLSLIVGAIGVVVPGLPTTPFVLLAAACFVRASPRAHAWLLANRMFGPLLREWEAHHSLPRRVKRIALITMLLTVSVSFWMLAGRPWLQGLIVVAAAVGCYSVARIPSRD